jgi:alpha-L-fucosidase
MKNMKKNIQTTITIFFGILLGVFIHTFFLKTAPPPEPFGAIPTQKQMDWQHLEYYMFIHFGPNTFADVEWGDGKECPKVFYPTDLDTRQWARTAKDAGMKGIIITAKHHDGFCLFPSKYSSHTVRESLWKDGLGDVLRELSEACKEYGLLFGVYLSPWDQNHPTYGTADYNQVFANTLTEVLTNYGKIFEQWFDGARPKHIEHDYDWKLFNDTVYRHQPNAMIFSDVGPDCRWMGNERGIAGETNWSTINVEGFTPGCGAPSIKILNEGEKGGAAWIPAEVDVSIRPGWFYSPSTDDKVKTLAHLMDIWYTSVGRNANLLLNVPPDRRGRIHENDSARLMDFRRARQAAFGKNLADGASAEASHTRGKGKKFSATNVLNENYDSYWTTNDDVLNPHLDIVLKTAQTFNRLQLQEYIPLGQRVYAFYIKYCNDETSDWTDLISATTIGYKRILRFPEITTQKLRIEFEAMACPMINGVTLFLDTEQY